MFRDVHYVMTTIDGPFGGGRGGGRRKMEDASVLGARVIKRTIDDGVILSNGLAVYRVLCSMHRGANGLGEIRMTSNLTSQSNSR